MNPFATRIQHNPVIWSFSAMLAVLGFLGSLAWLTNRERINTFDPDQATRIRSGTLDVQAEYQKLSSEVTKLREETTKFQNAAANESGQAKLLNKSLQDAKKLAGLTELEGPGISITLRDNLKGKSDSPIIDTVVHDTDVLRVVNELWNAGSEAISVNGHRVVTGTNFRCVGSVMLVNNIQCASPITIQALGDPKTLMGAMNLPGGIIYEIKDSGGAGMVQIDSIKKMRLPAYAGSTTYKFAVVPKDAK